MTGLNETLVQAPYTNTPIAVNLGNDVTNLQQEASNTITPIMDSVYFGNTEAANAAEIKEEIITQTNLPETVADDLILSSTIQKRRRLPVTTGMVIQQLTYLNHGYMTNDDTIIDSIVESLNALDICKYWNTHENCDASDVVNTNVDGGIDLDYLNDCMELEQYSKGFTIRELSSILRRIRTYEEYLVIRAVCERRAIEESGLAAQQFIDSMLSIDEKNIRGEINVVINDLRVRDANGYTNSICVEQAWEKINRLARNSK